MSKHLTNYMSKRARIKSRHLSWISGENFIRSWFMSISIGFGAIRSGNVSRSPKLPKKSIKHPILSFKVIQSH